GGTPSSARTSRIPASAASRAATIRSTSTWSTASTPSWRPAASAPPRPWAARAAIEILAGQLRLGDRREHRRRPHGLDPPARLLRRPRAAGSRPGYAALPGLAHPRPSRASRPAAHPQDQPRLALDGGVPHLLAAAMRPVG